MRPHRQSEVVPDLTHDEPRSTKERTVDDPMPNARPDGADQEDRSASLGPAEWTTGLDRLRASIEADLSDVASSAVREARTVVVNLERRGAELLRALDE